MVEEHREADKEKNRATSQAHRLLIVQKLAVTNSTTLFLYTKQCCVFLLEKSPLFERRAKVKVKTKCSPLKESLQMKDNKRRTNGATGGGEDKPLIGG